MRGDAEAGSGSTVVLHVLPRFNHGGASVVISKLAGSMRRYGVVSMVGCTTVEWQDELHRAGIPWLRVNLYPTSVTSALASFLQLSRIIDRHGIRLLHSHNRFSSLVTRAVAAYKNVSFVSTVHDLTTGSKQATRWACGHHVTVFSEAVAKHLMVSFGVSSADITVVPMEVDARVVPAESLEGVKKTSDRAKPGCVAGFVGRLDDEKGADAIVRCAPAVIKAVPDATFWFIGDGPLRATLEAQATECGIGQQVTFWGWRNDVSDLSSCFDVAIFPSRREGFGLAVLEAMALGKAVVVTNVGNLPDLVSHGQTGLVVESGDADALADSVIQLLRDPEGAHRMGAAARLMAQKRFAPDTMGRAMWAVYQKALARTDESK